MHDNLGAENAPRMLVFATQQDLGLLARSNHCFMDGTFKVVPELFFQLFTIHALHNSQVIPCVYALLPNKQQQTYTAFFQVLRDAHDNLNPETVLVDFELAAINALRAIFRNVFLQDAGYFELLRLNCCRKSYQTSYSLSLTILKIHLSDVLGSEITEGIQSFHIICGMYLNVLQLDYHEQTTILRVGIVVCLPVLGATILTFGFS